ncbi:NACHT domain-containing protein [Mucilaginibacter sp. JRF]|uniref:NACHT domain-containing protein n=1 Tax=Mucilaginibacter sp. JRF TaxID=2780088 RepID=UPI00187E761E|nr:NACHT domain-containing protein [Mucilaginibacter sp. JRF]MBE9584848.1 NACHT domain-containing protein [Mucilaginibacter sp. JRF]
MNTFLPHYFEELKSHVLSVAGISNIVPYDCKNLSTLISNNTRHRVSETTLKRIYGFAHSKFNPSLFTVDAMAKFCGHNNWDCFVKTHADQPANNADPACEALRFNAAKVTGFTLQALKNRSGIPYNQTIKRRFFDRHIQTFFNSDHSATVISAPAGYGKTIALCHWVDEQIEHRLASVNNDIILFFSSSALVNTIISGRSINDWLLAMLGYRPGDDIASIIDQATGKNARFFLIIDGLDEHMFKASEYRRITDEIAQVFALYQSHPWFKLIITMRPASWFNFNQEVDNGTDAWFLGAIHDRHKPVNVPPLDMDEIMQVCKRINPDIPCQRISNLELAERLSYPFYLQTFYRSHKDHFSVNAANHTAAYELIASFILNKVYSGSLATEKQLLLKELSAGLDISRKIYSINKADVNALLKQYRSAYNELLGTGFLREVNEGDEIHYSTRIHLGNKDFLEYKLAKKLLADNDYVFDAALARTVSTLFIHDAKKMAVTKWIVLHAVKNDQFTALENLANMQPDPTEKADLAFFIAELLEKNGSVKQLSALPLLDTLLGIELIGPEYNLLLNKLLGFQLTAAQRVKAHVLLALTAAVEMDTVKMQQQITELKDIAYLDPAFVQMPLLCLETIFNLLNYGITNTDLFAEINKILIVTGSKQDECIDLLMLIAMATSCNTVKEAQFTESILPERKMNEPLSYYTQVFKTMAYIKVGMHEKASGVFTELQQTYITHCNTYTPLMKAVFITLKLAYLNSIGQAPPNNALIFNTQYPLMSFYLTDVLRPKSE